MDALRNANPGHGGMVEYGRRAAAKAAARAHLRLCNVARLR